MIMKFTCEKYPGLWVHDAGVRFVDGEAEATGKAADALKALPDEYGVKAVAESKSKTRGKSED